MQTIFSRSFLLVFASMFGFSSVFLVSLAFIDLLNVDLLYSSLSSTTTRWGVRFRRKCRKYWQNVFDLFEYSVAFTVRVWTKLTTIQRKRMEIYVSRYRSTEIYGINLFTPSSEVRLSLSRCSLSWHFVHKPFQPLPSYQPVSLMSRAW